MKAPGAPDPLYVAARRTLLDALEAVGDHLDAVVLVGAQAVYFHAGDGTLAVAPYTTDGDLAIDPQRLQSAPLLEDLMGAAGFTRLQNAVGEWGKDVAVDGVVRAVVVDLLVPDSLGGPGRRAARIPPHHERVARKVAGLECTLVDNDPGTIVSLHPEDTRSFEVSVAGPSALVAAKVFKIDDRKDTHDRLSDKDALDVFRLLRAVPTEELARRFSSLRRDERSREVTERALERLEKLFAEPGGLGCTLASRALAPLEPAEEVRASAAALTKDLLVSI